MIKIHTKTLFIIILILLGGISFFIYDIYLNENKQGHLEETIIKKETKEIVEKAKPKKEYKEPAPLEERKEALKNLFK